MTLNGEERRFDPICGMWLAPEQVRLVPISDKQADYAKSLLARLHAAGVTIAFANTDGGHRAREMLPH